MNNANYRQMPTHWNIERAVKYAHENGIKTYTKNGATFLENVFYTAKVSIEDGQPFDCYLLKMDDWNGWKKPYFTPEVAAEVVKDYNDAEALKFDENDRGKIIHAYDGDVFPIELETITVNGVDVQVFDLSLGWIWSVYNEEKDGR